MFIVTDGEGYVIRGEGKHDWDLFETLKELEKSLPEMLEMNELDQNRICIYECQQIRPSLEDEIKSRLLRPSDREE